MQGCFLLRYWIASLILSQQQVAAFFLSSQRALSSRVPRALSPPSTRISMSTTAILFDFDGTLGDTETPAMEVAFWEVAPFLPELPVGDAGALERVKTTFIEDNAGRAFEFMVDDLSKERTSRGLKSVEDAWEEGTTDASILSVVNPARAKFGLGPLPEARSAFTSILHQQKEETNKALAVCTVPNPGVPQLCQSLTDMRVPFCIATTSGKPRVPISVKAAKLESFFPADKIHSGESDFEPSRFKPDPAVYLKAAQAEGMAPSVCVAVEDSGSGVGSAANAGLGFIIGYVGGTHIPSDKKDSHAKMLMSGSKSTDGRGAEVVVEDISNVVALTEAFMSHIQATNGGSERFVVPSDVLSALKGRVWKPECVTGTGCGSGDHH